MASWLIMSALLFLLSYMLSITPAPTDAGLFPRVQALAWKGALLNLAVHWIYWVARNKLGRLDLSNPDKMALALEKLAYAIMFGCGVIAWALVSQ
jgi:hypothetical protein